MKIWVYSSKESCDYQTTPNATGLLYVDGQCHTVLTETSSNDPIYNLLPGNYKAACTTEGNVHVIQSGCVFANCSSLTIGADMCMRDFGLASSLYSRLKVPEYKVLNSSAVESGGFVCSTLNGSGVTVTFTIIGDCSDPSCYMYGSNSSTPNAAPSTANNVPTASPIAATSYPTISNKITPQPTSYSPTIAISAAPSMNIQSMPTAAVTSEITSPMPTAAYRTEMISVSMLLGEIDGVIANQASVLWENVTTAHIRRSAIVEGYTVGEILTNSITQELLNGESQIISVSTIASIAPVNHTDRMLSTTNDRSVRMYFHVTMTFPESTPDSVTCGRVFREAFDTEAERVQYILQLVNTGDPTFANVKFMQILDDGSMTFAPTGSPVPQEKPPMHPAPVASTIKPPTNAVSVPAIQSNQESQSSANGTNMGLVIGALVGSLTLLLVCGFFLYHRGRKDALSQHSVQSMKGIGEKSSTTTGSSPITQRWTNEILLNPMQDDVSVLSGSIVTGLPGVGQATDEPTASVNVDFDFTRNQYRTGAYNEEATIDDMNTRVTNPTAVTSFSKLGILGAGATIYADDDKSFEQQYDDGNCEEGYDYETPTNATLPLVSPGSRSPVNEYSSSSNFRSVGPQRYQVIVPPGMLGMVLDTPGGNIPIVRAVKSTSVVYGKVEVGDHLVAVDGIDVTHMSAMQVSNLISTKSHAQRTLHLIRS